MTSWHETRPLAAALPDPARPMRGRLHVDGGDTEHESAASSVKPRGQQRQQILDRFRAVGERGATDYENSVALGAFRHACGTRREELIRDGWKIVDSGERRPTDTGRNAIVWKLAELLPGTPQSNGDAHDTRSEHGDAVGRGVTGSHWALPAGGDPSSLGDPDDATPPAEQLTLELPGRVLRKDVAA